MKFIRVASFFLHLSASFAEKPQVCAQHPSKQEFVLLQTWHSNARTSTPIGLQSGDEATAGYALPQYSVYEFYVEGEDGTNGCPDNSNPIETKEECEQAASILGHRFDRAESFEYFPTRCFRYRGHAYWNLHETGASASSFRPICSTKVAPPTPCHQHRYCSSGYAGEGSVSSGSGCKSLCANNDWYAFNPSTNYCMCYNGACASWVSNGKFNTCPTGKASCRTGGYCSMGFTSGAGASGKSACNQLCANVTWFSFNTQTRYCMCYRGDCTSLTPHYTFETCLVTATRSESESREDETP